MNSVSSTSPASGNNKTLWAVVGVLGIAVLAMGAALIRIQSQPTEPRTAVLPVPTQADVPASVVVANGDNSVVSAKPEAVVVKAKNQPTNQPVEHTNKAQTARKNVAKDGIGDNRNSYPVSTATAQIVHPNNPEPAVARPSESVAPPPCANCGTVERVTAIEQDGTGSGLGAVAGGVLGAVVGNQVGDGAGKALATVLGAVGGGMAGNAIEKKTKKVTRYDVAVRMQDGSLRTLQQATPPSVGAQVTLDGDSLHSVGR